MFGPIVAALQALAQGFVSIQIYLAGVCFAGTLVAVLCHQLHFNHVVMIGIVAVLLFSAANIMASIPGG